MERMRGFKLLRKDLALLVTARGDKTANFGTLFDENCERNLSPFLSFSII